MIEAMNNLVFISAVFVVAWAIWLVVPNIYRFSAWSFKGGLSILKAIPECIVKRPFFSFMVAFISFAFPYFALVVFLLFAIMLGDLGARRNMRKKKDQINVSGI